MLSIVTKSKNQEVDKMKCEIRKNLERAQEKRFEELLVFCEEFLNSEEYEQHSRRRNEIRENKLIEVFCVDVHHSAKENDSIEEIQRKMKKLLLLKHF